MSNEVGAKMGWLRVMVLLTRAKITCAVTLTTTMGYLLAARRVDIELLLPLIGVFLLAAGASALNQVQEARTDARMARTRGRPIPAGHLGRGSALYIGGLLILGGMFALASIEENANQALALGAFSAFWYNVVYTYLKRVTPFAVVPGALIGALPPLIGHVAGGGSVTDPVILLVCAFLFIWQIPHFWLLLLRFGEQYGEVGLPTLTSVFSRPQLSRLTFVWLIATAVAGLALPALAHRHIALPCGLTIVVASCWLAIKSFAMLRSPVPQGVNGLYRRAFIHVNAYALVIVLCLSLDALATAPQSGTTESPGFARSTAVALGLSSR